MAKDEQLIALGKLLAAYSLLCNNIEGAFGYLSGSDPESAAIHLCYLRPHEQAHAALQFLEKRSKDSDVSAKLFHGLRDSLQTAMDLSKNDFRLSGIDVDFALYVEKRLEPWSCLNVTLDTELLDRMALACFEAAIGVFVGVCDLRLDEERSSIAEKSDPPGHLGVSNT